MEKTLDQKIAEKKMELDKWLANDGSKWSDPLYIDRLRKWARRDLEKLLKQKEAQTTF